MPIEITMPRLSDTMEYGTVIKWTVEEGAEVSSGDVVADIETDKATMEMQVYDDGTIAKILVPEGEKVAVGTVIAVLAEDGEDVSDVASYAKSTTASTAVEGGEESSTTTSATATAAPKAHVTPPVEIPLPAPAPSSNGNSPGTNGIGRLIVSPVARRMADEHGLDLHSINGSGPNGRIIKRDVLQAIDGGTSTATQPIPVSAPVTPIPTSGGGGQFEGSVQPLSNMRQIIATRLVQSKSTIPHYQVTFTFNMDPILNLRKTLNDQLQAQGVKLSVNDFLVRACALSIHQHQEFNASWGDDKLLIHANVNIGVAISLPAEKGGGLVVATIRNADQKGLRQISEETKALAEKARTRGLSIDEMADSTFTISNLGMFGVEHFTAIINPPNSAILAVGAAVKKPVVRNDEIVVGHEMQATLSLDHRIIDGVMAARYLQTLQSMIENPAMLIV